MKRFKVGSLVRFRVDRWKGLVHVDREEYDKLLSVIGLVAKTWKAMPGELGYDTDADAYWCELIWPNNCPERLRTDTKWFASSLKRAY